MMFQQDSDDDPLVTSLLRILRHLEEEQTNEEKARKSIFFGRSRIQSAPELVSFELNILA